MLGRLYICMTKVRAMVVAVQQPLAECTIILNNAYCLALPTLCSDKSQNLHR